MSMAVVVATAACTTYEMPTKGVIPQPQQIEVGNDFMKLSSVVGNGGEKLMDIVDSFVQVINLPIDGDGRTLHVSIDNTIVHNEGYEIRINDDVAYVKAKTNAGVIYGLATLAQLYNDRKLPYVTINDYPEHQWRGFMLDVARHYFKPEEVKELLSIMAMHKLNKLHWHLTDGIGWRVQIDKYPALTDSAAWRVDKHSEAPWIGLKLADQNTPNVHGGFYTKEQIRDIVAYAKDCGIEIIPEIEMPGHSMAVLNLYPELKCKGVKGDPNVYCVGKEETYTFLTDILTEVAELFPSKYIHIGGDEVAFDQWGKCADCKATMRKNKIKTMGNLQGYFVNRIDTHLKSLGKTMVGWDELTKGELPKDAVITSWTGSHGGIEAAKRGNKAIMCPLNYVYFDHYQGNANFEPQAWGGANTLKRVYDFPVIPDGTSEEIAQNIIGGQANLWTENIATLEHLQYMMLPRMAALSEVLWSNPKTKNWADFNTRLVELTQMYDNAGWKYSTSAMTPIVADQKFDDEGNLVVTIVNQTPKITMLYTLDGTTPTIESEIVDSVVVVSKPATLKVAAFVKDSIIGSVLELPNVMSKAVKANKVRYKNKYDKQYSGAGSKALIDNKFATRRGDDNAWQGVQTNDFVATFSFDEPFTPKVLTARFFQHIAITSVLLPIEVTVSALNKEGNWVVIGTAIPKEGANYDAIIVTENIKLKPVETKRIRFNAKNVGTLPESHPKAGENAWVFVDEVSIN